MPPRKHTLGVRSDAELKSNHGAPERRLLRQRRVAGVGNRFAYRICLHLDVATGMPVDAKRRDAVAVAGNDRLRVFARQRPAVVLREGAALRGR